MIDSYDPAESIIIVNKEEVKDQEPVGVSSVIVDSSTNVERTNDYDDHEVYDVVVIGAGIAGLTAAYTLKKKVNSLKILVLEARDRVGGVCVCLLILISK
jgi:ribulose 1,5-bisphosphate synthetase/thiazole synthase